MIFLQFKKIARWFGLRAALLGAMGLVTLLFPEFLQGIRYLGLSFRQGQGGKAYCNFKSFCNGCGNPVRDFNHCLFPLPD